MQNLKIFLNRMSRKPELGIMRVQPSDDGFVAFWGDGRTETVDWLEVVRVFAYKVDCFTYDMIWLAFEQRGYGEALHVREEVKGFQLWSSSRLLMDSPPTFRFLIGIARR